MNRSAPRATFSLHLPVVRRLLVLLATIPFLVVNQTLPATAQETSAKGSVRLLGQSDWVQQGQPFDLSVQTTSSLPSDQVELVVTVFNPIANRTQYLQTLDDRISGTSVILERHPLSEVVTPDGVVTLSLPVQDPAQKRYNLKSPGIYPVRVDLRVADSGATLDRFVTHLIHQPQLTTTKLGVTTILPVQAPQSLDPEKPFDMEDQGKSVNTIAQSLAAHPGAPVSVLAEPETIDRLPREANTDGSEVLQSLVSAVGNRPVLRTTYTPLPPSLYASDLADELNTQFIDGKRTLFDTFPVLDERTWAATDPLETDALTSLRNQGVQRIVVREQDLSPQLRDTTLARPFKLSAGKNKAPLDAGQADAALARHFDDPKGPVLAAHRLLADLAVIWNDRPAQERAVIVMPPRNWLPDPGFLETFFRAMTTSPVLAPLTLDQYFETPVDGNARSPLTRQLTTLPKSHTQGFPTSSLDEVRERTNGLRNIAIGENPVVDDLERRILLSQRADLDNRDHKAWLDATMNAVESQIAGIRLPAERSIRLTARQGEIPVTVQNDNGYPVRVHVQLEASKLDFPAGSSRTIDVSREFVTERFAVVAKTSGAFGVQVRLASPNGELILERSEITIRSTATSAVGLGLSIGAIVFLIIWWIRSAIKTRRTRQAATA